MSRHIDADKLIAEIERWRDKAKEKYNKNPYCMGRCDALAEFRNHIVSLLEEQPEVELEKAYKSYMKSKKDDLSGNAITVNMKDLARHFYELGLNARKVSDMVKLAK